MIDPGHPRLSIVRQRDAEIGCAVVGPAGSVNQALAMIDAEAIDVAVLDVNVNVNGEMSYPIADALTARGVTFVFSTGYDKDKMLEAIKPVRCCRQTCPVLQKPYHRSELSDILAKLFTPKEPSAEPVIAAVT